MKKLKKFERAQRIEQKKRNDAAAHAELLAQVDEAALKAYKKGFSKGFNQGTFLN
jgi:flagellar biosynthesis/type III secretory pathway protein FliH